MIRVETQANAPQETGCDHIVGVRSASFPQHGEVDRLIRSSDKIPPDEPFNYCPVCGGVFVVPAFTTRMYKS
jgi:hypothetical protein